MELTNDNNTPAESTSSGKRTLDQSQETDAPAVGHQPPQRKSLSDWIVQPAELPEPDAEPRHCADWYLSCIPVADQPDFIKYIICASILTDYGPGWPEARLRRAFGEEYDRLVRLYQSMGGSRRYKGTIMTLRRLASCFRPALVHQLPDHLVDHRAGVEMNDSEVGRVPKDGPHASSTYWRRSRSRRAQRRRSPTISRPRSASPSSKTCRP